MYALYDSTALEMNISSASGRFCFGSVLVDWIDRSIDLPSTSDTVAISVVDLFDGAVAEGQFAHPVDAASDASGQAQAGVGGRRVESIRPEVVIAAQIAYTNHNACYMSSTRSA